MSKLRNWRAYLLSDLGILVVLGLLRLATILLSNGQLGWHRDELDTLDNARYLAWGYVSYPPLAPFMARFALTLFGPSLAGVRLFATLTQSLAMVFTGLMARELGGQRWAQITAACAVFIAPYALLGGSLFHYSSFDYLWWVLIAYQVIRLQKSDNPRWWIGIGAVIGVGLMTKYTIAFLVIGLVTSVILSRTRRHLRSPWLWAGVAISLLIVLPNLLWQIQHDFISLDFTRSIHARDVRIGRAEGFFAEQFYLATNVVTVPIWILGLYFYFIAPGGRPYRQNGWLFVIPFALFYVSQGRSYYAAAAYPALFAGGAVVLERWFATLQTTRARVSKAFVWAVFAVSGVIFAAIALPVVPVDSELWSTISEINGELKEEVGWPEMVETVAGIYNSLSIEDQQRAGILVGNYGEAGAINLYGPEYGLPEAISGVNSYWLRGFGDPAPEVLIVLGFDRSSARTLFRDCQIAGRNSNPFNVSNEESREHSSILLCREPIQPWPELWERLQSFG